MPTLDLNKIKIYDAGNTVADRYTIIFVNRKTRGPLLREALASSTNPFHPQSVGHHIECALPDRYNRGHLGRRLTLDDLPELVQQFVKDNFI